jgi:hypothetical protein
LISHFSYPLSGERLHEIPHSFSAQGSLSANFDFTAQTMNEESGQMEGLLFAASGKEKSALAMGLSSIRVLHPTWWAERTARCSSFAKQGL